MSASDKARADLTRLLGPLNARAAGLWRREVDRLTQVAFVACADMTSDVAGSFAQATRAVSLSRNELGIVRAVVEARTVVSIAAELPEGAGSGLWLRAFQADRSIAVPLPGGAGVVSVAVRGLDRPVAEIEEALLSFTVAPPP